MVGRSGVDVGAVSQNSVNPRAGETGELNYWYTVYSMEHKTNLQEQNYYKKINKQLRLV